ncbi:WXG100 family type VII secretion target [Streptomyces sp. NPDC047072]|uniref:WXG100 family type VII secretion target n=1 Tax=Streptomyces sp. NPDC047072 TaxID=3154809 RepID=UPI0033EED52C
MAGQQFTMTEESMVRFSGQISTVSSSIQSEIRRLQTVIDTITGGWKGSAATAYNNLQNQVNQDATKINQILMDIKEAIDQSTKAYAASEEEQHASIQNIAAQSPFG